MLWKPVWEPALVLALAGMGAGCVADADDEELVAAAATCGAADAYAPFDGVASTSGSVAALPWRGYKTSYPNGRETFDSYADGATIECASTKPALSHIDVTAGCLTAAVLGGGAYHRAHVDATADGAFRAVALGYAAGEVIKWTDQRTEYRFYYATASDGVLPGFKTFVRYRSEDDLYVASWRLDGVVSIQKKHCGVYTQLATTHVGAPSPRAWHRMRFDAIGPKLSLYLDDRLVLTASSPTFSWGTVGIRIDGVTGTYLDDWRVFL
ncbi:MAG TPA: hypothetical protein VIV11_29135 [Kofleriaceae bacterium]